MGNAGGVEEGGEGCGRFQKPSSFGHGNTEKGREYVRPSSWYKVEVVGKEPVETGYVISL